MQARAQGFTEKGGVDRVGIRHEMALPNSTRSRCARRSTARSRNCRPISMSGSGITTPSEPIRGGGAMAKPRCKRSLTHCRWQRRNCCRQPDQRHQVFVGHPPRRRPDRQIKSILSHLRNERSRDYCVAHVIRATRCVRARYPVMRHGCNGVPVLNRGPTS
jgi:hypothetical protein